jgi:RNA-directed DNA polymerase
MRAIQLGERGERDVLNETLMEKILEGDNLIAARNAVKRNRGGPGVDGITVDEITAQLRQHWPVIRDKLNTSCYQPALIKGVKLAKPGGGERLLGIPTVQDRIIQQAVQQQMSAIFEPDFSEHSYGFRPRRSAHDAVRSAQGYVQSGKDWVVDIDISAFFDHVNHDILMHRVSEKVRDKRVLKLIGSYLRAGMQLDGKVHKRYQGTPQGGPLSPLLANIYLDALDKELESRGLSFVRYADDLNIYVGSERSAQRVYEGIALWIEKYLRLTVNRAKSGTGRPWQRKFLGFRVKKDGQIGISPASISAYKEKVRSLWRGCQSLTSQELVGNWHRYIRGWWNYYGLAVDKLGSVSSWTRRHMRKCFWLRWHGRQGRMRHLRRLGVSARLLKRVDFHVGAWRAARHPAMHTALNNNLLRKYHLVTPNDLAESRV